MINQQRPSSFVIQVGNQMMEVSFEACSFDHGKQGKVFKGTIEVLNDHTPNRQRKDVCVKMIRLLQDNKCKKYAESELQILEYLKNVNHDNIGTYYGFYLMQNDVYLVFDYYDESLQQQIQRNIDQDKDFSDQEIYNIMKQLIAGLKEIHKWKLIHRDLKPENVMYDTKSQKYKIIDFGVSKYEQEGVLKTQSLGSPAFYAPEVNNSQIYDFRVDIYSLGIILYLLCYLTLPFDTYYSAQQKKNLTFMAHRFKGNQQQVQINPKWIQILGGLMLIDPKQRISLIQAEELLQQLNFNQLNHQPNQQIHQSKIKIIKQLPFGSYFEIPSKYQNCLVYLLEQIQLRQRSLNNVVRCLAKYKFGVESLNKLILFESLFLNGLSMQDDSYDMFMKDYFEPEYFMALAEQRKEQTNVPKNNIQNINLSIMQGGSFQIIYSQILKEHQYLWSQGIFNENQLNSLFYYEVLRQQTTKEEFMVINQRLKNFQIPQNDKIRIIYNQVL